MYTNWRQGWGKMGWPNTRPEKVIPPDRPPSVVYLAFPAFNFLPPFHYDSPVTGHPPRG